MSEPKEVPSQRLSVPEKPEVPVEVYQEMERRDENQIYAGMRDEQLGEFVHSIDVGGKQVTCLSYAGAKEYRRERGYYQIREVRTEQDEKKVDALVIMTDVKNQIDAVGAASAEKSKPFAWVLAVNKAERNAIMKLIPAKLMAALIKEWLERNRAEIVPLEPRVRGTAVPPESSVPLAESPMVEPSQPEPRSLASISDENLASELMTMPWRQNSKGKGWNIRWEDVPLLYRQKLAQKFVELVGSQYLKLGEYSYRRFGDQNDWLARYVVNPPEPLSQPAKTIAQPESPALDSSKKTWKVPIIKDQATPDQIQSGVKQFPLLRELKSFGMINTLDEETSIIPERPVPLDTPLIDGFLLRKIIEPMIAKHGLAYTIQRASSGFLEAVLIRGKLPDQQLKELVSGARWAFQRALEDQKP